jgi:hypothetical protein
MMIVYLNDEVPRIAGFSRAPSGYIEPAKLTAESRGASRAPYGGPIPHRSCERLTVVRGPGPRMRQFPAWLE